MDYGYKVRRGFLFYNVVLRCFCTTCFVWLVPHLKVAGLYSCIIQLCSWSGGSGTVGMITIGKTIYSWLQLEHTIGMYLQY